MSAFLRRQDGENSPHGAAVFPISRSQSSGVVMRGQILASAFFWFRRPARFRAERKRAVLHALPFPAAAHRAPRGRPRPGPADSQSRREDSLILPDPAARPETPERSGPLPAVETEDVRSDARSRAGPQRLETDLGSGTGRDAGIPTRPERRSPPQFTTQHSDAKGETRTFRISAVRSITAVSD